MKTFVVLKGNFMKSLIGLIINIKSEVIKCGMEFERSRNLLGIGSLTKDAIELHDVK